MPRNGASEPFSRPIFFSSYSWLISDNLSIDRTFSNVEEQEEKDTAVVSVDGGGKGTNKKAADFIDELREPRRPPFPCPREFNRG